MEPQTHTEPQDDLFWDEGTQMMLSRSGMARWREKLTAARAARAEHAADYEALRERLRLGPNPA
ncbi:hypothetical protein [Paractinoplanes maris]|uniref:hypothetical protein n=1 Tax=Paractinoplanes maris TaxID=1734446 RepID=UPI002021F4E7|nr:hypothetical protein [Actinoplanes maris]